jgi:ABC-type multidrug transport system fused ATPase/permease subunit
MRPSGDRHAYDGTWRWVAERLRAHRVPILGLAVLSALEVLLRVLLPWPMKAIVDQALGPVPVTPWLGWLSGDGSNRMALLVMLALIGVAIQFVHQLVLMSHTRQSAILGTRLTRSLREELFVHLQGLALRHHTRRPIGDSVHRLEVDAGCLELWLLRGVFPMTFSAVTLVAMFAILAGIDRWLALVSLSVVPFMLVWIRLGGARLRPNVEQTRRLESRLTARLHESFAAIRLIKSFAREPYETTRVFGAADEAIRARVLLSTREAVFSLVIGSLTVIGSTLVIIVGGLLVIRGQLTVGTLLVALAYLGFVYGPLSGIANTTTTIHQALAGARRVREILALTPEGHEDAAAIPAPAFSGAVRFEHVSFRYDHREVLDDVEFETRPGEMLALVGPSGAGKTTLVSLIPRLYEPTSGRILIDGLDVRHLRLADLRRQIAIVQQDAPVMSGTVLDNLRYGRLDASREEVESAARAANADEFIERLEEGYDTPLGESGAGLSGGQRQRLSMARAFLKDAPILILDEPTAALDAISEEAVFTGLRRLRAGRTTFVIAHRLSTIRDADRILVMDRGRIVDQGTHDTLLRSSTLYRRLAARIAATTSEADS